MVILAVWQFRAMAFAPAYIPRPSRTITQIPAVLSDQQFLSGTGSTLLAVIEGLLIAAVIGTATGLVMGRLRDVDRVLRLYVNSFYAMPIVALVPLLTVWFGYTPKARLAIIVIEATLPIMFSVAEGVRGLSGRHGQLRGRGPHASAPPGGGCGPGWRSPRPCPTCSAASTWPSAGR